MRISRSKLTPAVICFALSILLLLSFQNCDRNVFFDSGRSSRSFSGNGDTYTGKLTAHFVHSDPANPCGQLSKSGKPFPDFQLSVVRDEVFLVRADCTDLAVPQLLSGSEVTFAEDRTRITFQERSFEIVEDFSDYYLVPPLCRANQSVIASPSNLFSQGFNFVAPEWILSIGMGVHHYGVFNVLPRFQVLREAGGNPWERVSYAIGLRDSVDYAYSIILESGNTPRASVRYWASDTDQFEVSLDFRDGQTTVPWAGGVDNLQVLARPYQRGYILDVMFRTRLTAGQTAYIGPHSLTDSGIAQTGDFVFAAGAALYEMSAYCQ